MSDRNTFNHISFDHWGYVETSPSKDAKSHFFCAGGTSFSLSSVPFIFSLPLAAQPQHEQATVVGLPPPAQRPDHDRRRGVRVRVRHTVPPPPGGGHGHRRPQLRCAAVVCGCCVWLWCAVVVCGCGVAVVCGCGVRLLGAAVVCGCGVGGVVLAAGEFVAVLCGCCACCCCLVRFLPIWSFCDLLLLLLFFWC